MGPWAQVRGVLQHCRKGGNQARSAMTIIIAKRHYLDCRPTKSDTTRPRSRGMNCASLHLEREMKQGQSQPQQQPAFQTLALELLNNTILADFPPKAFFFVFGS